MFMFCSFLFLDEKKRTKACPDAKKGKIKTKQCFHAFYPPHPRCFVGPTLIIIKVYFSAKPKLNREALAATAGT
jgi:hypothetical protein